MEFLAFCLFQYIKCYCLSELELEEKEKISISIHQMLLFIERATFIFLAKVSISIHQMLLFILQFGQI